MEDGERSGTDARPLKVLAHVSHAWPVQHGGSETALHRTLAWLAARGHTVRGIVNNQRGYTADGVRYKRLGWQQKTEWWKWADVAITQQGGTPQAVGFAADHRKPLLGYAHNLAYLAGHPEFNAAAGHVLIANTRASLDGFDWPGRSFVLHPPVFPSEWAGTPGELVTQVNLSALKGGALFWDLARARPDTKFLGVVGGWGEQLHPDGHVDDPRDADRSLPGDTLPNVAIQPRTTDMLRTVYARTRVLLVPTAYVNDRQIGESYGIVAAEALASGIPVVARRSPGLAEQLDGAGFLLDSDEPAEWLAVLDELTDPVTYTEASDRARNRSLELDPTAELIALERLLRELAA